MPVGGFSLALAILAILGGLTYRDSVEAGLAAQDVDHTYIILRKLDKVLSDLKDAETGQRGYVITGKQVYLQPYHHAAEEIDRELRELRDLTGNNQHQQARLDEIDRPVIKKMAKLKQTIEIRKEKGYRAATGLVDTGIGEKLMDEIRGRVAAAEDEEARLLKERAAARKVAGRKLTGAIIGGGAVSAVLLFIAFSFLRNEIVRRIGVEEDLRKHQEGLEALVEERTRDLAVTNSFLKEENIMRRQAEEELKKSLKAVARSNEELDQFTAIASHDLRAPLRMVSGFIDLLARRYKGKLDEKADEYIAHAISGTERMSALLHDLYVYSRVGTEEKPFSAVELGSLLRGAVENLKELIDENGAIVTNDELPWADGDDIQLVQLFQNLIANAIKFRKNDATPRIHVSVQCKEGEWVVGIRDNGIGIEPRHYEHIFAIFQRLHSADEYPGTGLGLALCRKIVSRHGGRIWVESIPGQGSIFYFTIPVRVKLRHESEALKCSSAAMTEG